MNPLGGGQIASYYDFFRRDIIAAVPSTAKCVLSVGCAAGRTEQELVKKGIKVVGVEIDHEAASLARQRGLTVLEGDVSEVDIRRAGESYDCLIYADVLEHLREPAKVLQRHVEHLNPGGTVYVCVPNFRHYSVLWQLFVRGHVGYQDAGILDRTHLRITTRKMVLEWFNEVHIELCSSRYIFDRRKNRLISALLLGLAREFIAVQIEVVGRKEGGNG